MDKKTIAYAIHILDIQLAYCDSDPIQTAYYQGLKEMFNICVSDAYQFPFNISVNGQNKHYI